MNPVGLPDLLNQIACWWSTAISEFRSTSLGRSGMGGENPASLSPDLLQPRPTLSAGGIPARSGT